MSSGGGVVHGVGGIGLDFGDARLNRYWYLGGVPNSHNRDGI